MTQPNFNSVFVPWNYEKIMKKKKKLPVFIISFYIHAGYNSPHFFGLQQIQLLPGQEVQQVEQASCCKPDCRVW